ncbi:hypothetical protein [Flavobacterium psychrotrophum]|uniref:hypothetical protein n=1 Tax=Flavobacterium psychrotrophum TaxID=2294119 RepID=UPI000E32225F|nr:hypothetical protein [Flavobacterium psychrotrophum]
MQKHTYLNFWATALILLIIGFAFYGPEAMLDFNIHDTYIVIAIRDIVTMSALCYFLSGLPYLLFQWLKRRPSVRLTRIHTSIMVGGCFLYLILNALIKASATKSTFPGYDDTTDRLAMLTLSFGFVFVLIQVVFLINVALGIFRKRE